MTRFSILSLFCVFCSIVSASYIFSLRSRPDASESAPNPIKDLYPWNAVTGTINGTVSVVPIPFEMARRLIPAKYEILTGAYKSLLPDFPEDSYPLIVKAILDHDLGIPDFQSIHIVYPFVDLLGDGYSGFAFKQYLLVTSTGLIALAGSWMYGTTTLPATFEPKGVAYGYDEASQTTFLNAFDFRGIKPLVSTRFFKQESIGQWPLSFYVNVTNQPVFTSGYGCSNQVTMYNTSLSDVKTGVLGNISIAAPFLPEDSTFTNVQGLMTDIAFVENNYVSCASLKGYSGTGVGDRGDGMGGI